METTDSDNHFSNNVFLNTPESDVIMDNDNIDKPNEVMEDDGEDVVATAENDFLQSQLPFHLDDPDMAGNKPNDDEPLT